MKVKLWPRSKNFRVGLIVCCVISLVLALLTEGAIGIFLYLIGSTLGAVKRSYGWDDGKISGLRENYRSKELLGHYHHVRRFGDGTLLCVLIVIGVLAFILFVCYFWLLTGKIMKDMRYISTEIENIASGHLNEPLVVEREDELGEIARQVNRMQKEINRLIKSERDALQVNKDMIACVAHDLRTPVTSIVGYLQLATDTKTYSLEERQNYARVAMQKANRLERLIEDLFSYTKLMSGEISLHCGEVDIVKLVEQMLEEFYPIFQENRLECELHCDVHSIIMYVDGELIARAVQNLLSNATKYGKDGKQILVRVEQFDTEVQIAVTNFGLVIPKKSVDRLFDKFYRVENSRSTGTGGSGLGLNIVQEIALLHGGNVKAKSSVQGTTFTVALPFSKNGGVSQEEEKDAFAGTEKPEQEAEGGVGKRTG